MKKIIRVVTSSIAWSDHIKYQPKYFSQHFQFIGLSGLPIEKIEETKKREDIVIIPVLSLVRPISLYKDIKTLIRLILIFRNERPDIVHAHTPKASLLAMIAAKICKVPVRIYTVTGLRFETKAGFIRKILIFMEKISCKCATKVIPEGDGVAKILYKEKITRKPLIKILNGNINGVNLAYFSPNHHLILEAQKIKKKFLDKNFIFIIIGRLVKDKGVNELIASFTKLQKDYSDIGLFLLGDFEQQLDPLDDNVINEIRCNPDIYHAGWQKDIRPWLLASNVFVLPSHREGFPNVVLQAGAMGIPSIVSNISGCNEIIINGENGLVVPPQNINSLYWAMTKMIDDPNALKFMSSNCIRLISERFEQKQVWEAIKNMYEEELNKTQ